jgi:serine/threonine-protein kinase HipA
MPGPGDAGQFSLAGAQPKTALLFDGQRWGVPSGRIPTSHILKPALPHLNGHVENEHLCLDLARAFGFPAARSEARMFGDQQAIVVEGYDRVDMRVVAADVAVEVRVFATTVPVHRVHREDFCQALGLHPTRKYQSDGRPGAVTITTLLRSAVSDGQRQSKKSRNDRTIAAADEDIATFCDALIFNWLIGNTDAHAASTP